MESIRKVCRNLLGVDSAGYKLGHHMLNWGWALMKGELKPLVQSIIQSKRAIGEKNIGVKLKVLKYPLYIRPGCHDSEMLIAAMREEYGHILISPADSVKLIIDAGGYIGDTAAYLLSKYPQCRVIVLEPDNKNFAMLTINLQPYHEHNQIFALNKGLYGYDGVLTFSGNTEKNATGGGIQDGQKLENKEDLKVECVSMGYLIEKYAIDVIDILKLDIEGAEGSVLDNSADKWLDKVKMIIIEIHSEYLLKQISSVLERNKFKMIQYRSVWYCLNTAYPESFVNV